MNTRLLLTIGAIIAITALHSRAASTLADTDAPHFEIVGSADSAAAFPLKSTQVRASIAGVIAEVELTQTYANTGKQAIEAVYVFPGSTRAAVQGMEVRIGDRVITATIQDKQKAAQMYQEAKAQNKVASLLQQQRPNVFQMNVASIAPGAEVQVRLRYSERLVPEERVYEFVLPGVVGPRYTGSGKGETWLSNPFLTPGTPSPATLDFAMQVDAGMPLKSLTSQSHDLDIRFTSPDAARVTLKPTNVDPTSRDLIVRYQLADQKVNTGLLLHEGADENFFLLNVQPPNRVTSADIPARDYIFIVDVSGSMNGFPLNTAKTMMKSLLGTMREQDRFNVLLFSGGNNVMSPTVLPVTDENLAKAMRMIDNEPGGGGTELLPALQTALAMNDGGDRARSLVLVTDGYVSVEKEAFDLVRENLSRASLFAIGVGSSVNRHLVEGLAAMGHGEAFVVTQPSQCSEVGRRFRECVSSPVLTGIQVRAEGIELAELEPGSVPDLFADRPLVIAGKWKGSPRGRIIVSGHTATGAYEQTFDVAAEYARSHNHPALRPLWARERARVLGDYAAVNDASAADALTALGLKYSLLTANTSFVAVDHQPQMLAGAQKTVNQPLPLPQGVSQNAVGPSAGAVPEPGALSLIAFALTVLAMHRQRRTTH